MEKDFVLEYLTESSNIYFLYKPLAYYKKLCELIKNAKRKIVISCLYIGTLPLEQEFLVSLVAAKRNNPDLVIEILLDKQRSCRKENTGKCILDLLKPILTEKNVTLRLFQSPLLDSFLNSVLRPPFSEVVGTLHIKIYTVDNTTIITGANCSTPYFTRRMDRYMVVEDELFADVMHTVVSALATMGFKVDQDLNLVWESDLVNPMDDYLLFKKQIYVRLLHTIKLCNNTVKALLYKKIYKRNFKYGKTARVKVRKPTMPWYNKQQSSSLGQTPTSSLVRRDLADAEEKVNDTPTLLLVKTNTRLKELYDKNIVKIQQINKMKQRIAMAARATQNSLSPSRTASMWSTVENNSPTSSPTRWLDSTDAEEPGADYVVRKTLSGNYNEPVKEAPRRNEGAYPPDDSCEEYGSDPYGLRENGRTHRPRLRLGTRRPNREHGLPIAQGRAGSKLYHRLIGQRLRKPAASDRADGAKPGGNSEYCTICNNYRDGNTHMREVDFEDYKPVTIRRLYPPMEGYTRFMIFFQMGFSDPPFRQDEVLCKDLMLKYRKAGHSVVLVTSYLNLTDDYTDVSDYLINCNSHNNRGKFYMLTSAPNSNDFFNCTDYKRFIPSLYCCFQKRLLVRLSTSAANSVVTTGRSSGSARSGSSAATDEAPSVRTTDSAPGGPGALPGQPEDAPEADEHEVLDYYYEYYKHGYTFHSKGIYMFDGDIPRDCAKLSFEEFKKLINGPCAMLIGSSNLSRRSHNKDLEMNVLVESNSTNVLDGVKLELYNLFKNSTAVSNESFGKRANILLRAAGFFLRQYF